MAKRRTWWTREFKLAAIARVETAATVEGLAAELGVNRSQLLKWRRAYEQGGSEARKFPGQMSGIAPPVQVPLADAAGPLMAD